MARAWLNDITWRTTEQEMRRETRSDIHETETCNDREDGESGNESTKKQQPMMLTET